MKILYGTSNPAKLLSMRNLLNGLDIDLLSLNDMQGIIPNVPETGNIPLENAVLKAKAYYKAFNIPVFSCDSGLYFENLPDISPKVHVRNVNGKTLTDDEMIAHYSTLAEKHGDITARYRNAICFILDDDHIYTDVSDDLCGNKFLITKTPHPKRIKGFPLDSLSKDINNGLYFYDSENSEKEVEQSFIGFKRFFEEVLCSAETL